MGGSKPSAPVTYIPTPAAPTLYKSVIPEADFARAGEYLARIKADRKAAEQQRYQQVGTPTEIGARQAAIQAQAASSYAASLPQGSQYDAARQTAQEQARKASRAPISTVGGLDPNVFNAQDYETASKAGYSDAEIKDWLEQKSDVKIGPIPQEKFGLSPDRVTATGKIERKAPVDTTPSWAVGTATEQAAQAQRDKEAQLDREAQAEEARVNRMIKAKELAEKAKKAGVDGTATPAESTPALADSAARYV